jgi:hypothetical protein
VRLGKELGLAPPAPSGGIEQPAEIDRHRHGQRKPSDEHHPQAGKPVCLMERPSDRIAGGMGCGQRGRGEWRKRGIGDRRRRRCNGRRDARRGDGIHRFAARGTEMRARFDRSATRFAEHHDRIPPARRRTDPNSLLGDSPRPRHALSASARNRSIPQTCHAERANLHRDFLTSTRPLREGRSDGAQGAEADRGGDISRYPTSLFSVTRCFP